MNAYCGTLEISGVLPGDNPLPFFRDQRRHRPIRDDGTLRREATQHMGWELAFRALPYRMQDDYTRDRKPLTLPTAILENEHMKAVFLPTLGGRLHSLFDKDNGRELLYVNPVLQPANLAIRNAWFSGGIEWNLGRTGHTYNTCAPVFFARCRDGEGQAFWRMYEYDRCEGLCWSVDFHLPSGARALVAHARIYNTQDAPVPMYWWTNIAVREARGARVLSGTRDVLYIHPESMSECAHAFGQAVLPDVPSMPGVDASFPELSPYANEYFFQTAADETAPWEAVVYPEGWVFAERSTARLRYRKMFCWGNHPAGQNWRDYLSVPGQGAYLEVQGGFAPTQLHGMPMPEKTVWSFTQAFSSLPLPDGVTQTPYQEAMRTMESALDSVLSRSWIEEQDARCAALSDTASEAVAFMGSGWGALEQERRAVDGEEPLPLAFPVDAMTEEQQPWLSLLREWTMPESPAEAPGLSYLTGQAWETKLEDLLSLQPDHDTALVHLGIMRYEAGAPKEAVSCWERAMALRPTALAARNLAQALRDKGHLRRALPVMEQAISLLGDRPDYAYIKEYAQLLLDCGEYRKAFELLSSCPEDKPDILHVMTGKAGWLAGQSDALDDAFFARTYADVREGENPLTELWFAREAKKRAEAEGRPDNSEFLAELRRTTAPPRHIDFRMFAK